MRNLRKHDGFTLVELLVTIVVGSIVAAAAATTLFMGLRTYNKAKDTALKQNEIDMAVIVMEKLLAEAPITQVDAAGLNIYDSESTQPLLSADGDGIRTRAGVLLLPGAEAFSAELDGRLLRISFRHGEREVSFSVYCRMAEAEEATEDTNEPLPPVESGETTAPSDPETDPEEVLDFVVEDEQQKLPVREFLKVLSSQQGSTGRIQTPDGEGQYYSEWYIGGYDGKENWSAETPWCACFVSWALEQCSDYIEGTPPRYANVDTFCTELVTSQNWKDQNPAPGDLIFFDWSANGDYNPEHIGVVIGADESRVYTIEGNVNGRVVLRSYALNDARILGYGLVNWKK